MILPDYVRHMALYNEWQNEQLFGICAELGEVELQRDRGLYFGSIHDTLDHILFIDRLILGYCREGKRPSVSRERQCQSFAELQRARKLWDSELLGWADEVTPEYLAEPIFIPPDRSGRDRQQPRGFMITQMFNHQTHHRSQVTSHLHSQGIDYGVTDLPFNPKIGY